MVVDNYKERFDRKGLNFYCIYTLPQGFSLNVEVVRQFETIFKGRDIVYTMSTERMPDGTVTLKALITLLEVFRSQSKKRFSLFFNGEYYSGEISCKRSPRKTLEALFQGKNTGEVLTNRVSSVEESQLKTPNSVSTSEVVSSGRVSLAEIFKNSRIKFFFEQIYHLFLH